MFGSLTTDPSRAEVEMARRAVRRRHAVSTAREARPLQLAGLGNGSRDGRARARRRRQGVRRPLARALGRRRRPRRLRRPTRAASRLFPARSSSIPISARLRLREGAECPRCSCASTGRKAWRSCRSTTGSSSTAFARRATRCFGRWSASTVTCTRGARRRRVCIAPATRWTGRSMCAIRTTSRWSSRRPGPYLLEIVDPTGQVVHTVADATLSTFGALSGTYAIPQSAAVGWYQFRLTAKFGAPAAPGSSFGRNEIVRFRCACSSATSRRHRSVCAPR